MWRERNFCPPERSDFAPVRAQASVQNRFELRSAIATNWRITDSKWLTDPKKVYQLIKSKLKDYTREHFYIIILNSRNWSVAEVSIGSLNASIVHPREVFSEAIKNKAASAIFVHNHPSGDPEPSEDDLVITKRLVEVGKIMGIEIIDHVIVAKDGFVSLKEKGIIK